MYKNNNNYCCPSVKCCYERPTPTCKKFHVCQCYEYSIICKPCKTYITDHCSDKRKDHDKPFDCEKEKKFDRDKKYDYKYDCGKGFEEKKEYDHGCDCGCDFGIEYDNGYDYDQKGWGKGFDDNQEY